jgi:hypothetical protein
MVTVDDDGAAAGQVGSGAGGQGVKKSSKPVKAPPAPKTPKVPKPPRAEAEKPAVAAPLKKKRPARKPRAKKAE